MLLVIVVSLAYRTTASKPGFSVPAETRRIQSIASHYDQQSKFFRFMRLCELVVESVKYFQQQEQESTAQFSVLPASFDVADYAATREFLQIFGDNTLTGHEWNSQMLEWAKKNGVYKPFLLFKRELERRRRANEEDCLRSTHALYQFFRKYYHVGNNYAYTWKQVNDVRENLIKELTPKQMRLATLIAESYTPHDVPQLASHRNLFRDEFPGYDDESDAEMWINSRKNFL